MMLLLWIKLASPELRLDRVNQYALRIKLSQLLIFVSISKGRVYTSLEFRFAYEKLLVVRFSATTG